MSDMQMLTEAFRPYSIDDLFGQARAKKLIGSWLRTGRMPRTILISGETSAGKTTLARIMGRSRLCSAPDKGNACGECDACKSFDDETHPDYIEMNAASERGINDMRQLAQKVSIRPLLGKSKIIVLDEAHQITQPGWQAMLKTLEEPPAHVVFIILTTDPQKIKATILDRCSRVTLQGVTVEECTELLLKVSKEKGLGKAGLEKKHLVKIAKVSKGRPRKALHALEQVYTMVLDATDAGQTIDTAVVNTFIEQIAVTDVETLAAGVARSVLEGKTGGALGRAQDAWAESDQLLTLVTEIMRQAMFLSSSPKLMDRYYANVLPECKIFSFTGSDNDHHLEARRAVLDAYSCFTRLRIDTSNYTVPVSEVIGEAISRAALVCQVFLKEDRRDGSPVPKKKRRPEAAPAVAEAPKVAVASSEPAAIPKNGTSASKGKVKKKKKRTSAARLPE